MRIVSALCVMVVMFGSMQAADQDDHERKVCYANVMGKSSRYATPVDSMLLEEFQQCFVEGSEKKFENFVEQKEDGVFRDPVVDMMFPTTWYAFHKLPDGKKIDRRVFSRMINKGILDVDQREGVSERTLLFYANSPDEIAYLMDNFEPNYHLKDRNGNDALMYRLTCSSTIDAALTLIHKLPHGFFKNAAPYLKQAIAQRSYRLKKKCMGKKGKPAVDAVDKVYCEIIGELSAKVSEKRLRKDVIPYAQEQDRELPQDVLLHNEGLVLWPIHTGKCPPGKSPRKHRSLSKINKS